MFSCVRNYCHNSSSAGARIQWRQSSGSSFCRSEWESRERVGEKVKKSDVSSNKHAVRKFVGYTDNTSDKLRPTNGRGRSLSRAIFEFHR